MLLCSLCLQTLYAFLAYTWIWFNSWMLGVIPVSNWDWVGISGIAWCLLAHRAGSTLSTRVQLVTQTLPAHILAWGGDTCQRFRRCECLPWDSICVDAFSLRSCNKQWPEIICDVPTKFVFEKNGAKMSKESDQMFGDLFKNMLDYLSTHPRSTGTAQKQSISQCVSTMSPQPVV